MTIRGKHGYFPKIIMEEVEQVKKQKNIENDGEALREMAKYSMIGREVENLESSVTLSFLWNKKGKK